MADHGSIVGLYLLVTMAAGLAMQRYVGSVDDFLLAGREMDVFLGIASLAATEFGIVTCMYAAASIVVSATIPIAYLILSHTETTAKWATEQIGPNYSGIAAFVLSALAMVVGSLLRPLVRPTATKEVSNE